MSPQAVRDLAFTFLKSTDPGRQMLGQLLDQELAGCPDDEVAEKARRLTGQLRQALEDFGFHWTHTERGKGL